MLLFPSLDAELCLLEFGNNLLKFDAQIASVLFAKILGIWRIDGVKDCNVSLSISRIRMLLSFSFHKRLFKVFVFTQT